MTSILGTQSIQHPNGTASVTIASNGGVSMSGTAAITGNTTVGGTLVNTGLITASAGVAVGGTGSANTLDDYEEGTFTPTLVSSGSTFAYSVQQGIYTKVGDLVTFNVVIQLDGGGNSFSSNSVSINGWPFTSRNSQGAHGRFFIHGRYLNVDTSGSYYYAFAQLDGNSASAPLKEGGDNIPIASLGANRLSSSSGQLYLHGHYYTDA